MLESSKVSVANATQTFFTKYKLIKNYSLMIVDAVIERGKDGTYSIYMDKKDIRLNYLVTGSGKTIDDAKNDFLQGYDDMKEFFNAKGKDFRGS